MTLTFQHLMCMPLMQVRPNSFSYHHEIWCIGNFLQRLNRLHTVNTYGFLFGFKIAVAVLWCFKIYKQTGWFYQNVELLKKRNSFISNIWVQWDPCNTEKKYSANKVYWSQNYTKTTQTAFIFMFFPMASVRSNTSEN